MPMLANPHAGLASPATKMEEPSPRHLGTADRALAKTGKNVPTVKSGAASTTSPNPDPKGATPPEYKRPNRWGLTAGGSQRHDWLTGKNRFELHDHINARKVL
ncbi:MAG: hypothetical protein ACKN9W_11385, partial [Methylococcus sp.]